ncbi:DUF6782 family putative metallopeptidase [Dermatobacter hominis]|uniref:DUF6782 family putative metallopeptidase n=1 Tax=Dermatobacter hominis TaxID=2884263 RepID=UPI0021076AC6|nr:DUF6782 family putative metallopeptidase [Dermatobacter hominis]
MTSNGRGAPFPPPGTPLPPLPPPAPVPAPDGAPSLPPPYEPAAGSPPLPPPAVPAPTPPGWADGPTAAPQAPPPPAPWASPAPPPSAPGGWGAAPPPGGWAPQPQGWGAPPGPPSSNGSGRTVVVRLVVALVVLALGVGAALIWADGGEDHPSEWDPRVQDLVAFVEDTWGRDFDHPVAVHMLDADEYRERATAGEDPAEEDLSDADDQAAAGRALGLFEGELDLFETGDAMVAEGTAAFYDPMTDEIVVNGEALDVGTRVTLVHELTHALQAQVVAAGGGGEELDDTSDAANAYRSLLEGDATVVEQVYAAQLSDDEYEELLDASTTSGEDATAALEEADVPGALQASFVLPYGLGAPWVDVLLAREDGDGLEAVLVDPPVSTSSMVDLQRSPDEDPVEVEDPEIAGEVLETDRFGPMSWIVPLAEFTDGPTAFEAVRGWTGDSVVTSRTAGGRVCVDAAVELRDDTSATRFEAAVRTWFGQLPPRAGANVSRDGSSVRLSSCDPGADADIALTGRAMDELGQVVLRNQLIAELAAAVPDDLVDVAPAPMSVDAAACTADRIIASFGAERLLSDEDLAGSSELLRTATEARAACGD